MKPKLNKNLSLPWTPHGTRRESEWKKSNSLAKLNFHFLALSSRVLCINSLTPPTMLL